VIALSEELMTVDQRPLYQGEPGDEWHSRDLQERARQTVLWCVSESARHYERLRTNQSDFFDRYCNQPVKLKQTSRKRSNVPSGRVSEIVDTFVSDLMTTIEKVNPLVSALPNEVTDQNGADLAQRMIQYNFENFTPTMGWWPVVEPGAQSAAIYGACPNKLIWETRFVKQPVFDKQRLDNMPEFKSVPAYRGPVAIPIFIFDHFPHPHKLWADDIYPQVHLSWQSFGDIKALEAPNGPYTNVDKIVELKDMKTQMDEGFAGGLDVALGDMYQRSEQRQHLGWTDDSRLAPDGVLVLECECMFRPGIEYTDASGRRRKGSEPIRTIITLANGVPIRVGPSPLPTGDSIWGLTKFNHITGQFYGQSIIQKVKAQVHIEEVALNMWLQSMGQILNKPKVVRPDLLRGPQSIDDEPGGVILAKRDADVRNVIYEMQTSPVGQEALQLIAYSSARSEGVSGATDLKQGRLPTGERTATASNIAFSQSSKRFRHALIWFGVTTFSPWAKKMWGYNQAYLDTPFAFRVLGGDAKELVQLTVAELAMNPDFRFMGPTRDENEGMVVSQLQSMLQRLTPFMMLDWGQNAAKEFIVQIAQRQGIIDIARFKTLIQYEGAPSVPLDIQARGEGGEGGNQTIGAAPTGAGRQDRRGAKGASNATSLGRSLAQAMKG